MGGWATARARVVVGFALVAIFGLGLLIVSLSAMRERELVRSEALEAVRRSLDALSEGPREAPGEQLNGIPSLLSQLEASPRRVGLFRSASSAVAAHAGDKGPAPAKAAAALRALAEHLQGERQQAWTSLLRKAFSLAVAAVGLALLSVFAASSPAAKSPDPDRRDAVRQLSRLVEEAEGRERQIESFLLRMEAVMLSLDGEEVVRRATPGAAELFGVDSETKLLGRPARELIRLTTETGESIASFRSARPPGEAVNLERASDEVQVTLEVLDMAPAGSAVLLRRVGPRHARLKALKEINAVRNVTFDDPDLGLLLFKADGSLERVSSGATAWFGSQPGDSYASGWVHSAGLSEALSTMRSQGRFEGEVVTGQGHRLAVRAVRLPNDGGWFRAIRIAPHQDVPSALPTAIPREAFPADSAQPQVLVIDDEPAIGRALQRTLRGQADVTFAPGGAEGLEAALANPDAWSMLLCDIGMPEVDGVQVFHVLKSEQPGLLSRTIFMTGALHTDRARRFVDEQSPRLITKPFDIGEIRALLSEVGHRDR